MKSIFKTILILAMFCLGFATTLFKQVSLITPNAYALESSGALVLMPDESLEYIKNNTNIFILDVRDRDVARKSHLAGSVNIPAFELETFIHEVPLDRPILIHCHIEKNAKHAIKLLEEVAPDSLEIAVIRGKLPFE